MTIARFNLMLKKSIENKELIKDAKKMYPSGKLPVGAIFDGLETTKSELRAFMENQKKDKHNEKFPMEAYHRRSSKLLPGVPNI